MERAQVQREAVKGNAGRPQPAPETGGQAREVELVTFIADKPVDDIAGSEPSKRSRGGQHIVHDEDLASFAFHQPPLPPPAWSSQLASSRRRAAVAPSR